MRMRDIGKLIGIFVVLFLLIMGGVIAGSKVVAYLEAKNEEARAWMKGEAEQYKGATEGEWGEIVHRYEGKDCEVHRWRYRGVYYLGHVGSQCGGLMEDPS
jgi:hypothetical protein